MYSHGIDRKYELGGEITGEFGRELSGEGYRVLTVSIDPRDGDPVLAAALAARDVDLYQCKYCLRPYYTSFVDIRRHMQSAHGMTNDAERQSVLHMYNCRICRQQCRSISDGIVHLRSRHPGVIVHGNVWDAYANMERVDQDSPSTHVNTSASREPRSYQCMFCARVCDSAADVLAHMHACHAGGVASSFARSTAELLADVPAADHIPVRAQDQPTRAHVTAAASAAASTSSHTCPACTDDATAGTAASTAASTATSTGYECRCCICGWLGTSLPEGRRHVFAAHPGANVDDIFTPSSLTMTRVGSYNRYVTGVTMGPAYASDMYEQPRDCDNGVSGDTTCVICMHAVRDTIVIPCGHLGFCGDCIAIHLVNSRTCPICRARIASVHKVHSC